MKLNHVKVLILNHEYWVDVIWGDPYKMWKFARRKYNDVTIPRDWFTEPDCRGQVLRRANYNPLVVLYIDPNNNHFWSTLAHESCHAIDEIWEMIKENAKRHEVFAHSVGAVVAAVERKVKQGLH